jgi:murein DD-endopeptidase MepM/ murein hydrolase activator NlpD
MRLATIIAAILFIATSTLSQSKPSICPIKDFHGKTSEFGKRVHPILKSEQDHNAIDFFVRGGTPVLATADGKVVEAETIENYGTVIRIQHKNHIKTFYAHLSNLAVKAGQTVKCGDVIAYSGNSGVSTGPHLHYEVIQNGVNVNPRKFFASK